MPLTSVNGEYLKGAGDLHVQLIGIGHIAKFEYGKF